MNEFKIISVYDALPRKDKNKMRIKFKGKVKVGGGIKLKDKNIENYMIDNNVFGFFFKPVITQDYLMNCRKIPVLYLRVDYMKNLIRRPMMSVWLFFEATEEEYSKHKKLDSEFSGKYIIEAEIDGESEVLEELERFTDKDDIKNRMKEIVDGDINKEMYKGMIDIINEKRKKEGENLNFAVEPPKVTINKETLDKLRKGVIKEI